MQVLIPPTRLCHTHPAHAAAALSRHAIASGHPPHTHTPRTKASSVGSSHGRRQCPEGVLIAWCCVSCTDDCIVAMCSQCAPVFCMAHPSPHLTPHPSPPCLTLDHQSATARLRKLEAAQKANKGSQLKANASALTHKCAVCMTQFVCTVRVCGVTEFQGGGGEQRCAVAAGTAAVLMATLAPAGQV